MQRFIKHQRSKYEVTALSLIVLSGIAAFAYFFRKKIVTDKIVRPSRKIDIEIRYDADKDADATMLAQNQVKIIRMVLTPLEKQILDEQASLIYVYGGDYWEMRLKNASEELKTSIREALEAKEW